MRRANLEALETRLATPRPGGWAEYRMLGAELLADAIEEIRELRRAKAELDAARKVIAIARTISCNLYVMQTLGEPVGLKEAIDKFDVVAMQT